MKDWTNVAKKVNEVVSKGLVCGLGTQEPGKMCVEAAVCYAMGLEHSDQPSCVDEEVRQFKIYLNDLDWSSNMARAKGLKKVAIAQLGSVQCKSSFVDIFNKKLMNSQAFKDLKKLAIKSQQEILDKYKNKLKNKMLGQEDVSEMSFDLENDNVVSAIKGLQDNSYMSYEYFITEYIDSVKMSKSQIDTFLTKMADIGLAALKEMKSPGCKYLHLAK